MLKQEMVDISCEKGDSVTVLEEVGIRRVCNPSTMEAVLGHPGKALKGNSDNHSLLS